MEKDYNVFNRMIFNSGYLHDMNKFYHQNFYKIVFLDNTVGTFSGAVMD